MATVITNLFSAIPFIGQDVVQWLWGGFNNEDPYYSNIILNKSVWCWNIFILLIDYYIIKLIIWNKNNIVKISINKKQSAVINNKLLIIQRLNSNYSFNNSIIYDKNHKLNTDNPIYAYIVGLIEGNGWINITKKGKYLLYEIGIEISNKDIQLIHKIKNILGVGLIIIKNRKIKDGLYNNIVIFRIRNKNHLKNIIIPIFDKYNILTNKQYDYLFFKENLLNNVKHYDKLSLYIRPNNSIYTVNDILNKYYLSYWLIGFIEVKGCFSIYKPFINYNKVVSIEINQINNFELIEAIKIYLKVSQNIYLDKFNNNRIILNNISDICNIIKILQNNPIKLLGYKKLQYNLFLKELRLIPIYIKYINIPQKY